MSRILFLAVIVFVSIANIDAFTYQILASQKTFISEPLFMASDDEESGKFKERGVSYDQDGKSNVWAIEPKMELESKSKEEKGTSALTAFAGIGIFGILAAVILTNLPDPDQF